MASPFASSHFPIRVRFSIHPRLNSPFPFGPMPSRRFPPLAMMPTRSWTQLFRRLILVVLHPSPGVSHRDAAFPGNGQRLCRNGLFWRQIVLVLALYPPIDHKHPRLARTSPLRDQLHVDVHVVRILAELFQLLGDTWGSTQHPSSQRISTFPYSVVTSLI